MPHFFLKLVPPRPTFAQDMSDAERETMQRHAGYLAALLADGRGVAFGPVMDPAGIYGMGIVEAADEAAALSGGREVTSIGDAVAVGVDLYLRGMSATLVKGGHWGDSTQVLDVLVTPDGHELLVGPRIATDGPVHGTGCALSTAIACHLALGRGLEEACRAARAFVADRVAAPVSPGRGRASVL